MINAKATFQDELLEIVFEGEAIPDKTINIPTDKDVNFNELVNYLVELIPKELNIASTFNDYESEKNTEKLKLIEEIVDEIFLEFNKSITNISEEETEIDTSSSSSSEEDDLPF